MDRRSPQVSLLPDVRYCADGSALPPALSYNRQDTWLEWDVPVTKSGPMKTRPQKDPHPS